MSNTQKKKKTETHPYQNTWTSIWKCSDSTFLKSKTSHKFYVLFSLKMSWYCLCDVLSKNFVCLYMMRNGVEEKPMNISKSTNKGKNKCVFSIFSSRVRNTHTGPYVWLWEIRRKESRFRHWDKKYVKMTTK